MTAADARRLLVDTTTAWVDDTATDIVWAGEFEGRWGIRMAQQCRDFTTVWFTVGDLTVRFDAYLLPMPPHRREDVLRFCLIRNWASWPAALAIDREGDLMVTGRVPSPGLDVDDLDRCVGAVYETVELSFRPLVEMGFRPPVG